MNAALDRLAQASPEMRSAVDTVRALARAMVRQSAVVAAQWPAGVPNDEAATARSAARIAALEGEPLLDGRALMESARAIGAAAGDAFRSIVSRLAELDAADIDAIAAIAVGGQWDAVATFAARLDVDAYALVTVLDYAARPALIAGAQRVQRSIVPGERTACPACGGPPLLAELSGKDGARTLRCARCGTGWSYARIACAWCGERDHRALSALHGEGDAGAAQAECCGTCRGYLKSLSVLAPGDYLGLLELDLASAGLDLAAVERGYSRRPHV